ncbi:hypothetical protein M9H77_23149 [Catharanthus roseus]|uniref:Uncharacterized protein n=1 Tax=Catharanthus roseus TaxID=4058 RepID=A0ACC0AWI3_CATRO|nr:hypothetical protein M9H77_23149 [Catharanthus roseus]
MWENLLSRKQGLTIGQPEWELKCLLLRRLMTVTRLLLLSGPKDKELGFCERIWQVHLTLRKETFKGTFLNNYFPSSLWMEKEREFFNLEQTEGILVVEYAHKFNSLGRFVPEVMGSENLKMIRFEEEYIWVSAVERLEHALAMGSFGTELMSALNRANLATDLNFLKSLKPYVLWGMACRSRVRISLDSGCDRANDLNRKSEEAKDLLHGLFTSARPKKIKDNDENVDNGMVVYMENALEIKLEGFEDEEQVSKTSCYLEEPFERDNSQVARRRLKGIGLFTSPAYLASWIRHKLILLGYEAHANSSQGLKNMGLEEKMCEHWPNWPTSKFSRLYRT